MWCVAKKSLLTWIHGAHYKWKSERVMKCKLVSVIFLFSSTGSELHVPIELWRIPRQVKSYWCTVKYYVFIQSIQIVTITCCAVQDGHINSLVQARPSLSNFFICSVCTLPLFSSKLNYNLRKCPLQFHRFCTIRDFASAWN